MAYQSSSTICRLSNRVKQHIILTNPTIHLCHTGRHSEHKCAHFCSKWCIVRYGACALRELWIWSIVSVGYLLSGIFLKPVSSKAREKITSCTLRTQLRDCITTTFNCQCVRAGFLFWYSRCDNNCVQSWDLTKRYWSYQQLRRRECFFIGRKCFRCRRKLNMHDVTCSVHAISFRLETPSLVFTRGGRNLS